MIGLGRMGRMGQAKDAVGGWMIERNCIVCKRFGKT